MAAQVPTKIVLKSTTKMSLNDRFTSIQQQTRPQPTVQNIRANMAAQQQASAANRRLAQQLANRPGIGMMNPVSGGNVPPRPPQQQRSLQQRLGKSNIKARLNFDAVGRGGGPRGGLQNNMQGRGRGFMRGGPRLRGRGQGGMMQQNRGRGQTFSRGGGGFSRPNLRGRGGDRGRGNTGFRGGFNRGLLSPRSEEEYMQSSGGWRGRGQGRRDRRGGRNRGDRFGGRGAPGGGRGPGMRGRGRGRGRGNRGGVNTQVSKEQLDNQLDEYMSKTKSHLDSELDAYMAEANP